MTGFKGTPGPWSVRQSQSDMNRYYVVDKHGICISCDDEYSLDDAAMSSAAPELLAALISLQDVFGIIEERIGEYETNKARAAIAKALGEQK